MFEAFLKPRRVVHAHCDLPCGIYDPAQARIEAESVKACQEKYQGSDDPIFKDRAISIKEQRANLVKEHLWVLWTVLAFILVLTMVFVIFEVDIAMLIALVSAAAFLLRVAYGRSRR